MSSPYLSSISMLSKANSNDINIISFRVLPVDEAISSITFIISLGNRSDITEVSDPYRRGFIISFFSFMHFNSVKTLLPSIQNNDSTNVIHNQEVTACFYTFLSSYSSIFLSIRTSISFHCWMTMLIRVVLLVFSVILLLMLQYAL